MKNDKFMEQKVKELDKALLNKVDSDDKELEPECSHDFKVGDILKQIFVDIVVWFIMIYAFNQTYKEMRKECYELDQAHRI